MDFKPIPGFDEYEISPDGTVRNATTKRLTTLYTSRVMLYQDGVQKSRGVKRLTLMVHSPAKYAKEFTRDGDDTFKKIPGFPKYEVSESGVVWGVKFNQKLAAHATPDGYLALRLVALRGKPVSMKVHRLVMMTHRPEVYDEDLSVDHVDRDRSNNHVDNLRMATSSTQRLNQGGRAPGGDKIAVVRLDEDCSTTTYASAVEAARQTGVCTASIRSCCKNRQKTAGGYEWKYEHVHCPEEPVEGEAWKRAGGTETFKTYVSNHGRVRVDIGDRKGPIKNVKSTRNGYPSVRIGGKLEYLHVVVAELFLPPPADGHTVVNHIDGDKTNATASNLEWVTASENTAHAHRTGLIKKRRRVAE